MTDNNIILRTYTTIENRYTHHRFSFHSESAHSSQLTMIFLRIWIALLGKYFYFFQPIKYAREEYYPVIIKLLHKS